MPDLTLGQKKLLELANDGAKDLKEIWWLIEYGRRVHKAALCPPEMLARFNAALNKLSIIERQLSGERYPEITDG